MRAQDLRIWCYHPGVLLCELRTLMYQYESIFDWMSAINRAGYAILYITWKNSEISSTIMITFNTQNPKVSDKAPMMVAI